MNVATSVLMCLILLMLAVCEYICIAIDKDNFLDYNVWSFLIGSDMLTSMGQ